MQSVKSVGEHNTLFWVSAVAFCVLLLRPLQASWVLVPVCVGGIAFLAFHGIAEEKTSGAAILSAACFADLLLGFAFAAVWLRTKRLVSLTFFDWKGSLPVLAAAALCTPLSLPFTKRLLCVFYSCLTHSAGNGKHEIPKKTRLTGNDRLLIFCTAFAAVSVCSMSSPLYPFNDWVDANCFFTVGKSMLSGLVPYRDLYEQKGPLLYALYALCYPVSHTGFLGVWVLELISGWFYLNLCFRTIHLLTGKKSPLLLLLTAALTYTAPAFLKGGSAEELCLPLLMLSLFFSVRALVLERDLTFREGLFIGLSSGAVLWIKYSMLGFYIGFFLVPAGCMLRKGHFCALLRVLFSIIAGVVVVSLPVLLYFGRNHALSDLWQAYFWNNLFVYGKTSTFTDSVKGLLSGAASMLTYNDASLLLVAVAVIGLLLERRRLLALSTALEFAFAFVLIYAGGINMKYYSEILCVFIPVGLSVLARALPACEGPVRRQRILRTAIPLLFAVSLFGTENRYMLNVKRSEMPQYIFAETIRETPDATLFNYGALDIGQYTVCDILPTCRYFCMLNIQSDEMYRAMEHYMTDGVTDYIVSRSLELTSPHYELVETVYFMDNNTEFPYYLYRNKEIS